MHFVVQVLLSIKKFFFHVCEKSGSVDPHLMRYFINPETTIFETGRGRGFRMYKMPSIKWKKKHRSLFIILRRSLNRETDFGSGCLNIIFFLGAEFHKPTFPVTVYRENSLLNLMD